MKSHSKPSRTAAPAIIAVLFFLTVNVQAQTTCATPLLWRSINLCSPANGASLSSPVHVLARANDRSPRVTMQVLVDNVQVYYARAKSVDTNIAMASGAHQVTVQARDGSGTFSKTASITVPGTPPPPAVSVSITPTTASISTAGSQQFTATVTGSTNTAVTWSATGGTVTTAGLFSSPSAGTFTVQATSVADTTKSASATVTVTAPPPPPPVSVTVTPTTASISTSASQQFTATVTGSANTAVTWSATGGTVTTAGLFSSTSAGTFTVQATSVADTTKSASATVTVTAPPPPPPVSVSISPASVTLTTGGSQQFTATVTGSANTAVTWSASGGTISVAGLFTGTVNGSFTVTATSVADSTKSASATVTVNAPNTSYGNVGDPYEGGSPDPGATLVSSCRTLNGGSYRLTANVSGSCFVIGGPGVMLDLGGFTVTGLITYTYSGAQPDGLVIFNGSINCNTGAGACINIQADASTMTQGVKFHHLTINNSNLTGTALSVDWPGFAGNAKFVAYHITANAAPGSAVNSRVDLLGVTGLNQTAEFYSNDLYCPDARSCEAMVCYRLGSCLIHDNRVMMTYSTSDEPGRAILVDGDTGGPLNQSADIYNNLITANNCRAVRIRNATGSHVHDNTIKNVRNGPNYVAAIHMADADTGSVNLNAIVERNSLEFADGRGLMVRDGYNLTVRDNTVLCLSGGCSDFFAQVRTQGGTTNVTLQNNPTVVDLPSPQTYTEPNTSTTLCNSGTAGGSGSIGYTTSCQ